MWVNVCGSKKQIGEEPGEEPGEQSELSRAEKATAFAISSICHPPVPLLRCCSLLFIVARCWSSLPPSCS
jgi:hypothetical protein